MVIMRDWSGVSTFRQLHRNTFEKFMSAASVVMVLADYRSSSDFWMGKLEGNADSCRGIGAFLSLEMLLATF